MKQIEEYIESNTRLMEEAIEEFNNIDPDNEYELQQQRLKIERFDYYVRGLKDAKKYIEEEMNENE